MLPWDGNCFLTESGWGFDFGRGPGTALPEVFCGSDGALDCQTPTCLHRVIGQPSLDEPQVLFRRDAHEEFDPHHVDGRRPKVALLWRLGVPGPTGRLDERAQGISPGPKLSPEAHQFATCGWHELPESGQQMLGR